MVKGVDRAAIAAENEIYIRLGRVLLGMISSEYLSSWIEVLLHVEHVQFSDSPEAFVMETTLVLRGGERLPLIARPDVLRLSRELDELCKEQSGKAWRAYDYRLSQSERGPKFQCRYTYPDTAH